jgi:hypothetical protein
LPNYLVDEIQEVYRLQGVKINDKHIEVIVRQMLRKVEVAERRRHRAPLRGEQIDRARPSASRTTELTRRTASRPTACSRVLLGITKASLATESFISARLLPETTRVLTEAAVRGLQGRPARPEGKRHRRTPHPGRYRLRAHAAAPDAASPQPERTCRMASGFMDGAARRLLPTDSDEPTVRSEAAAPDAARAPDSPRCRVI